MGSLDQQLRQIIKSVTPDVDDQTNTAMLDRVIPEIKQAFADEGYVKPVIQDGSTTIGILTANQVLCSGQEWYDRFDKERRKLISRGDGETWMGWSCKEVIEAARRAAGLE